MHDPGKEPAEEGVERTAQLLLGPVPGAVEAAGATVRSVASAAGVAEERLTGVRAVAEELVREAFGRDHAGAPEVALRVIVTQGRIEVEVGDRSLPVTAGEARQAPSRRLAALHLVDELHITSRGKEGNLARMVVELEPRPDATLGLDDGTRVAADAESVEPAVADGIEVRRMEEPDADEVVRCVYRCYGYSYKSALMYEPASIRKALRRGLMHSVVATAPGYGVVGHSAVFVERPGDPVPESGRLVVDPRFRGHGIANRMAGLRRELAADRGLPGYWAEAVTNHPASQREIVSHGGVEVGLLIGGSPPIAGMVGFDAGAVRRHTLLATYTPLNPAPATIHICERHESFIRELTGRLGLEREVVGGSKGAGSASGPTETELASSAEPASGLGHIHVASIAPDLAGRVADELESFGAFDLGAIHLDLPLADPGAPDATEALEHLGFSLAAWIPRFAGDADGLRMQRTGSHPVETEGIVCARPEGEAVRDYVLADWRRVRRGELG